MYFYQCPICKKSFTTFGHSGWAYKVNFYSRPSYYCSYTCMRKVQRIIEEVGPKRAGYKMLV